MIILVDFSLCTLGIDKNEIDVGGEIKTCGLQRCNATDWRIK